VSKQSPVVHIAATARSWTWASDRDKPRNWLE